jgi:hypothetical protein
MRRICLAAGALLAVLSEAEAQSKYDIVWTSPSSHQATPNEYNASALIINRQTNKVNSCGARIVFSPYKLTASCGTSGSTDYRSHFPPSANVILRSPGAF